MTDTLLDDARANAEAATVDVLPQDRRPYPPSWLHILIDRIERLPGPTWLAYAIIASLSTLVVHGPVWISGRLPVGAIDPPSLYYGIAPVGLIWTAGYLQRVAGAAFDAYRPALTLAEAEAARLRFELTVMPAVPSLVLTLAVVIGTAFAYIVDPVTSGIAGVPLPFAVGLFLVEIFNGSVFVLLVLQLARQMRHVRRTLARSTAVDLFQPGPLYAFSRLTSRTGMLIVAFSVPFLFLVPPPVDSEVFFITFAPYIVLPPVIAVVGFLLPLYGMHARLVAEKDRLQDETEARLKGLLATINGVVDSDDMTRAYGLSKALAMLLQQRDVVARLPTWPWSAGTLRTFVTAIFLPIGLFLVQRLLSQFV